MSRRLFFILLLLFMEDILILYAIKIIFQFIQGEKLGTFFDENKKIKKKNGFG